MTRLLFDLTTDAFVTRKAARDRVEPALNWVQAFGLGAAATVGCASAMLRVIA